jgi:hypothetical protein
MRMNWILIATLSAIGMITSLFGEAVLPSGIYDLAHLDDAKREATEKNRAIVFILARPSSLSGKEDIFASGESGMVQYAIETLRSNSTIVFVELGKDEKNVPDVIRSPLHIAGKSMFLAKPYENFPVIVGFNPSLTKFLYEIHNSDDTRIRAENFAKAETVFSDPNALKPPPMRMPTFWESTEFICVAAVLLAFIAYFRWYRKYYKEED